MATFEEPFRSYKFSDGRLIELALEKIAYAERDVTEMATKGISAMWVADFETRVLAFGALPSDDVERNEQVEATAEKDADKSALFDKLFDLRSSASRAFGEKSATYKSFGLKGMDKFSDGDLLKAGMVAHGVAVTYVTELTAKGYTASDNTALQTLITDYVGGIQNKAMEVGSRDNAQEGRVVEGNEIYQLLENELCEAGKTYWRTLSAARLNDYFIHNNELGFGAPPNVTTVVVNDGSIIIVADGILPGDAGDIYVKNSGPAPCILHLYFAAVSNQPYSGTGVTLAAGEHRNLTAADIGPIQPYLLVQNSSGINGSLDFAPLG